MKFLEENGLVYDKPTKNGNYNISQKKPEVVSSRIDQTPLSNFPNNFCIDHPRLTKQSFHNTLSNLTRNSPKANKPDKHQQKIPYWKLFKIFSLI